MSCSRTTDSAETLSIWGFCSSNLPIYKFSLTSFCTRPTSARVPAALSPKFVVVFLNTDDIGRSLNRHLYKFSESTSSKLIRTIHPIARYPHVRELITNPWIFAHSALWQSLRYAVTTSYSEYRDLPTFHPYTFVFDGKIVAMPTSGGFYGSFQNKDVIRYAEALFLKMNRWCIQHHAKLLIIEIGYRAFVSSDIHDPTNTFLKNAPAFFAKHHIAFYDTSLSFKKQVGQTQFWIVGDDHPNVFGAKTIAKVSWPWIKKQILISSHGS